MIWQSTKSSFYIITMNNDISNAISIQYWIFQMFHPIHEKGGEQLYICLRLLKSSRFFYKMKNKKNIDFFLQRILPIYSKWQLYYSNPFCRKETDFSVGHLNLVYLREVVRRLHIFVQGCTSGIPEKCRFFLLSWQSLCVFFSVIYLFSLVAMLMF